MVRYEGAMVSHEGTMVTVVDMDGSGEGAAPRRRRLPAAERRETILRSAAELFAQVGYRAAKVSDVAGRVGVSEPVIFQNFGSKAALFAAVVERAAAEVTASLDDLAAGFGSASGLLAHVLTGDTHGQPGPAPAGHGARPPGPEHTGPEHTGPEHTGPEHTGPEHTAYGVLFAAAATLATGPELTAPTRDALRAVASHLAGLVQHAQAAGGIRPDADPGAAAWLLLSVLSARRLRAAAMPAGLEPAVTALVLDALAPPAAAAPGHDQAPPDGPGHPDTGQH
jgi:AcrR family transcriptional regulator